MKHDLYILEELQSNNKRRFEVIITADENDADYVTESRLYTIEEFHDGVIEKLVEYNAKVWGRHKHKEYVNNHDQSEDNPYDLCDYLPIPLNNWDYEPCHTLEKLSVRYYDEEGKVWDVKLNEG